MSPCRADPGPRVPRAAVDATVVVGRAARNRHDAGRIARVVGVRDGEAAAARVNARIDASSGSGGFVTGIERRQSRRTGRAGPCQRT